jgi:hypothetical protein
MRDRARDRNDDGNDNMDRKRMAGSGSNGRDCRCKGALPVWAVIT